MQALDSDCEIYRHAPGDALLFAVLCASASYIAVPAAMRMTVQANPARFYSSCCYVSFQHYCGIPLFIRN